MTPFASPINNADSTLAVAYKAGSGSVTLATGYGAVISAKLAALGLPAISASAPLRFTLVSAATSTRLAIYEATGLTGDVLSGVTVQEGTTDLDFAASDLFAVRPTAGQTKEIQVALNAAEANIVTNTANIATNAAAIASVIAGTTTTNAGALQAYAVATTAPTDQQVLTWSASAGKWGPASSPVAPKTVTTDYTIAVSDRTILVNADTGPVTITLLSAATTPRNPYKVKKIDVTNNAVTLTTTSSQTIDGNASYVLQSMDSLTVESDGSNWWIT